MIQDCHSRPDDLYDRLCRRIGRKFNLMHYWGPLASHASSAWIVDAVRAVLEMEDLCPELLLTYLPHLDYDTQRHGPESPAAARALVRAEADVRALAEAAQARGFRLLVWGDYAMQNVSGPAIFPNRLLREAGWLPVRRVKGMAYPDLWSARAFAVADHQTAQIHIPDPADVEAVREGLTALDGVASVFRPSENPEWDHPNAGELIALAQPGRWFAYPWWTAAAEAPDFASHVDIHNKPGFDPCELFFGRFPWQVCQDTSRVGGTHGAGGRAAWACDDPGFRPAGDPTRLRDLALALRDRLGGGAV
jgi:predicted AlkP superfamily pyrophosphatase or phosphodiesterase